MKPSKTKFPRGFTLAEVMLATTIAVIASSAIFTFLIFGLRSNAETVNAIANSDAIRKTTQRLMQDIRAADNSMVLTSINDLSEVDLEREGDVLLLFYNGWDITSSSDKVERYVVYFIDNSNELYRIEDSSISLDTVKDFDRNTIDFNRSDRTLVATNVECFQDFPVFERLPQRIRVQASFVADGNIATAKVTLYNFVVSPRG